ncbi:MAG: hypothetical protein IJW14_02625 [Oscillospiraceae bacterium]|nr:hypothetical protein [Oscillospiraceae bacterium]
MKSRTSFFNLTVLRKDITRFAPVWSLYLIGGLLIGLGGFGSPRDLADAIAPMAVINFLYAMIAGEMLFGDLFNSRLCNALHAFPLRRESWFATHTAAGLLFSFGPNLILCLCFLPFLGDLWFISLIWLLGLTLEYLFFFGLAAFSAMCTGNRFAMAAVYTLINFLSMVVYWFVMTFYEPLLYGLHIREDGFVRFCPVAQTAAFSDLVEIERYTAVHEHSNIAYTQYRFTGLSADWWYLAILAVLGIAFLAAALLLYRRRKLEAAGDFVAFRWLKPIFCVVFTLSTGAFFELIGQAMFGIDYLFLTVGIVVGYFVSQMLLQRTVRVFRLKAFGACLIIGGALVASILLTALDPLGITRWTPNPDQVVSVEVSENYYYEPYFTKKALNVSDPEIIEAIVQTHRQILAEGKETSSNYRPLHLTYRMADGRQVTRRYYYNPNSDAAKPLDTLFSSPEYILGYEDWDAYLTTVKKVSTENATFYGDEAHALLEAIRADCEAGHMLQSRSWVWVHSYLQIETNDGDGISITIFTDCENTLNWLQEH